MSRPTRSTCKTLKTPSDMGQDGGSDQCFEVSSGDRIAPDCAIRHPVWPIVALQRRVRFSARLAGFSRVGGTRDALEGRKGPHFRIWSLISISEGQVCAKWGAGADRGQYGSGKEAIREAQNEAGATAA